MPLPVQSTSCRATSAGTALPLAAQHILADFLARGLCVLLWLLPSCVPRAQWPLLASFPASTHSKTTSLLAQVEKQVTKDAFETVSAEEAARRGPSMEHQIIKEEELLERLQEINRRHVQEAGDPAHGNLW